MSLKKNNLPLSLNQGINTKIDEKQLPFGQFSHIENVKFDKEGEYNKRNGYTEIKGVSIGSTNNQPIIGVSQFKDQLLWLSRDQIYSYSQSSNVWQNEGSYDAVVPMSQTILSNGKEQSQLQIAYLNGYRILGWLESGKYKVSIIDEETGSYVISDTEIPGITASGSVAFIRMQVYNGLVWFFWTDGSRVLKYNYLNLNNFLTREFPFEAGANKAFTSEATVATLASDQRFDVAAGDTSMMVVYYDNSASELRLARWDILNVVAVDQDPWAGTALTPHDAIDFQVDGEGKFILLTSNGSGVVKISVLGSDGSLAAGPTTIKDVTTITGAHSCRAVTAASADNDTVTIFMQVYQTSPRLYTISTGTNTNGGDDLKFTWSLVYVAKATYQFSTGTVGTTSIMARGVGLASKAFVQDETVYVNVIRETDLHATYYTMKSDGSVQAKISQGQGGSILNNTRKGSPSGNLSTGFFNYDASTNANAVYTIPSLSDVPSISSTKFLFASKAQGRIISGNEGVTSYFTLFGVNSSVLDFDNKVVNQTVDMQNNLNIAGGQLKCYDGNVLVEQGFNYPPNTLFAAQGTGSTGPFETKTYNYLAVYSWTDIQGNVFKSALSSQASVTCTAAVTSISVNIPTLDLTQKTDVYVELYRTEGNGSVFYKTMGDSSDTVDQTSKPIINRTDGVDFVLFTDQTSDAKLIANELLYTEGGEVENVSPPSNSLIATFKNRLFLAGLENKLELKFSKIVEENTGIGFNDTFRIVMSGLGGDITALKGMDDKLIIFKRNAIFFLSGDGPNNIGEQNTFIEPQLVSSDIGCVEANSVVLTPQGLFFKSNKGIYLLERSLVLKYIGFPVDDFNNLNITKADIFAKDNEVRFLTSDGFCLVYNYFRGFWSLYDNHRGVSSVVVGDDYYYVHVSPDGNKLYKQSPDFDDAGVPINMTVETGWINPAGSQSSIRIYRMLVLGDYFSPHRLKVSVCYNYDDTFSQTKIIDVADQTEIYRYGDPGRRIESGSLKKGFYGDPGGTTGDYTTAIAYGGKDVMQYQYRLDFVKQKCESFKIKIETVQGAGELGRGINLSQIMFVLGSRGTDHKIKQSKIFSV